MEQWDIDPLYSPWPIPGDNPYNQSGAVSGAPSVFASHIWQAGYIYSSMPIPARLMGMLQDNLMQQLNAPPVPHSGSVNDMMPNAPRSSNQDDIAYANLKAPRF